MHNPVNERRCHDETGLFLIHSEQLITAGAVVPAQQVIAKLKKMLFPVHPETGDIMAFSPALGCLQECPMQISVIGNGIKSERRFMQPI